MLSAKSYRPGVESELDNFVKQKQLELFNHYELVVVSGAALHKPRSRDPFFDSFKVELDTLMARRSTVSAVAEAEGGASFGAGTLSRTTVATTTSENPHSDTHEEGAAGKEVLAVVEEVVSHRPGR